VADELLRTALRVLQCCVDRVEPEARDVLALQVSVRGTAAAELKPEELARQVARAETENSKQHPETSGRESFRRTPMLSAELEEQWQRLLGAALQRYEDAQLKARETSIERLSLPVSDGELSHRLALREETEMLRTYTSLLSEYCRRFSPPVSVTKPAGEDQ
jgi:hypothetical protein